MHKVFISYARDDDEAFVQRLYDDLTARGVSVWWDRKAMESRGRTFLQEIRDAIASIERVILVVGPSAASSAYVKAEWEFALEVCKVVIPILRLGDRSLVPGAVSKQDYLLIPGLLRQFHCPDFRDSRPYDDALAELRRVLAKPPPPLAQLHGVEALPAHFVARARDLEQLSQVVLADLSRPTVITPAKRITALHGMSGVGKSVLAAAFARACATRRAFEHGVIWVRLGRAPALSRSLALVGLAFQDPPEPYVDLTSGGERLASVLADRNCLLILDDVWQAAHVAPFINALGPLCRALITSRDAGIAAALGALGQAVGELTEDQALLLLAEWTDRCVNELPPEAGDIARECGNLPLALAMVGAMVRGKPANRWADALGKLQAGDLEQIRQEFPNYPYPTVLRAIQVSVEALESPLARECYLDLAVVHEGSAVPEAVLELLWERRRLDRIQTHDLIDLLVDRSLARRDPAGRLFLHDLQADFVRSQQRDLQALHRDLVRAYEARTPGGWHTGPDDGYYFAHLFHHLKEARRGVDVHRALSAETADGNNAWYEAKEGIHDSAGYRADVELAWQLAEETAGKEGATIDVGLQCRYALITASLNSMAQVIPPALLAALVRNDIWTPAHALGHALQIPDEDLRAQALAGLAPHLSEDLLRAALAATNKGTALAQLAPRLAELGHAPEALALVHQHLREPADKLETFWDAQPRLIARVAELGYAEEALAVAADVGRLQVSKAWKGLVPYLPAALIPRALQAIRGMEQGSREKALIELAPVMPQAAMADGLAIALASTEDDDRSRALAALAPSLSAPQLSDARSSALTMNELWRARTLVALAVRRPAPNHEALQEALAAVRQIEHHSFRAHELMELAPHLPPSSRAAAFEEALDAARGIAEPWMRPDALRALAAALPADLLSRVFALTRDIPLAEERGRAWRDLAQVLPDPFKHEALRNALAASRELPEISDGYTPPAEALLPLVSQLPDPERREAVEEVFDTLRKIDSSTSAEYLLDRISPYLSEGMVHEALAMVGRAFSPVFRSKVLISIAPRLTEPLWKEALDFASRITTLDDRARCLATLASHMSGDAQREAVDAALATIRELPMASPFLPIARPEVVNDVAARLPGAYIRQVLAVMRRVSDEETRAETLAGLAPHLPAHLLAEAVDATSCIGDPARQGEALAALGFGFAELGLADEAVHTMAQIRAPLFRNGPLRELVSRLIETDHLSAALAAIPHIEFDLYRDQALEEIAARASGPLLLETLDAAGQIQDGFRRAEVLCKLVPNLPRPRREEVLRELLTSLESASHVLRFIVLSATARYLPGDLLPTALALARQVIDGHSPAETLARVGPQLEEPQRSQVLSEALAAARGLPSREIISSRYLRAEVLIELIPHLTGPEQSSAIEDALAAVHNIDDPLHKIRTLAGLAPHLAEPVRAAALREAIAAAGTVGYREDVAKAWNQLAVMLPHALLPEALAVARQLVDDAHRTTALTELAAHAERPSRSACADEALRSARSLPNSWNRATALFELVKRVPEVKTAEVASEVLEAARASTFLGVDVHELVPRLPAELKPDAVRAAWTAAVVSPFVGKEKLIEVARALATLPAENARPVWNEMLHSMAGHTRDDLLSHLRSFAAAIAALGGSGAIEETFQAIRAVGRWWP